MDWGNVSHMVQALIVVILVVLFVMGYRAGDKV
jgi:hypothetical protein